MSVTAIEIFREGIVIFIRYRRDNGMKGRMAIDGFRRRYAHGDETLDPGKPINKGYGTW